MISQKYLIYTKSLKVLKLPKCKNVACVEILKYFMQLTRHRKKGGFS